MKKGESYRTKRDDKGKMHWVPMSHYLKTLDRTVEAGLTKSQAEWHAASYRSFGKNARAVRNMQNGTYSVWVGDRKSTKPSWKRNVEKVIRDAKRTVKKWPK
jgi:hypothetical protein